MRSEIVWNKSLDRLQESFWVSLARKFEERSKTLAELWCEFETGFSTTTRARFIASVRRWIEVANETKSSLPSSSPVGRKLERATKIVRSIDATLADELVRTVASFAATHAKKSQERATSSAATSSSGARVESLRERLSSLRARLETSRRESQGEEALSEVAAARANLRGSLHRSQAFQALLAKDGSLEEMPSANAMRLQRMLEDFLKVTLSQALKRSLEAFPAKAREEIPDSPWIAHLLEEDFEERFLRALQGEESLLEVAARLRPFWKGRPSLGIEVGLDEPPRRGIAPARTCLVALTRGEEKPFTVRIAFEAVGERRLASGLFQGRTAPARGAAALLDAWKRNTLVFRWLRARPSDDAMADLARVLRWREEGSATEERASARHKGPSESETPSGVTEYRSYLPGGGGGYLLASPRALQWMQERTAWLLEQGAALAPGSPARDTLAREVLTSDFAIVWQAFPFVAGLPSAFGESNPNRADKVIAEAITAFHAQQRVALRYFESASRLVDGVEGDTAQALTRALIVAHIRLSFDSRIPAKGISDGLRALRQRYSLLESSARLRGDLVTSGFLARVALTVAPLGGFELDSSQRDAVREALMASFASLEERKNEELHPLAWPTALFVLERAFDDDLIAQKVAANLDRLKDVLWMAALELAVDAARPENRLELSQISSELAPVLLFTLQLGHDLVTSHSQRGSETNESTRLGSWVDESVVAQAFASQALRAGSESLLSEKHGSVKDNDPAKRRKAWHREVVAFQRRLRDGDDDNEPFSELAMEALFGAKGPFGTQEWKR